MKVAIGMLDPIDPLLFFCCFSDDAEEVPCPHGQTSLTVASDDPCGQERFQCCECGGTFTIDWDERKVWYGG